MKYFIIVLMLVSLLMLISYFVALISKNKVCYAVFRLLLLLVEILLIITWIASFIYGHPYVILIPLIVIFGILLYES